MTWRIGSLFAGVGGIDLGLHAAGVGETAWFSEYDKDASAVLAARFPGVPNHGDVTAIDWNAVEPVDVLVGGYPCQPFSFAGQRGGADDARHLWPHFARAIRVLRPRYALLENVSGHLSLGFDAVLGDLCEAGFDAVWTTLRASDVGAPHRRERLFVVAADADLRRLIERDEDERGLPVAYTGGNGAAADADGLGRQGTVAEPRRDDSRSDSSPWGAYAAAIARWEHALGRAAPAPVDRRGRLNAGFSEWMMGFPEGWVTDVLPRNPALRCIGNAVVPQVAAVVGAWLLEMTAREAVPA